MRTVFAAMNDICAEDVKESCPTRATIAVPAFPRGANAEIDIIVASEESC